MMFRTILTASLLFAATPVAAEGDGAAREIVVTGISEKDSAAALAACIARGCPPAEEMRAALAHAENQFVGGRYEAARITVLQSIDRNRKYASTMPVEVSDLYRASGRIAAHVGDGRQYQRAILDMRDILRKNLPDNDLRALAAQIEVGESRAKLGHPEEALRIYADVENKAKMAGQPRVAAFARYHRLTLDYSIGRFEQDRARRNRVRAEFVDMAANPGTGAADFGLIAEVMLAQIDRHNGDPKASERLIARFLAEGGAKAPVLLSAEPIKIPQNTRVDGTGVAALRSAQGNDYRWVDFGFWINGDGRVTDVEILRAQGATGWTTPVVNSIKSRIYAPLSADSGDVAPAAYRVERYSYSAWIDESTTGTRIATRGSQPRIERIDLTGDTPAGPGADAPAPTKG
jgi:hypothetical protein